MAQRLFNTRFGKLCIVLYKGNIPSYVWSWHQFSACTEMVQVVETILDGTMITSSNGNSHHMETFSALLAFCYWPFVLGIHWSPVNSPHKGQWRGALMFSLICARINGWANNREAGDLRHHRAHYDIIVMRQGLVYLTIAQLCQEFINFSS